MLSSTMSGVTLEMSNEMTFWIFQLNLKVCPFTLPPVSQHCLTVAKCVLMTATFSGVYFKESASTMSLATPNSHHRAPSVCTNWCPEGAFNGPGGTSCSVLPLTCFSALLETAEQLQVAPMEPWWACPPKKVFKSCLLPNSWSECSENMLCVCSENMLPPRLCSVYCIGVFRHLCTDPASSHEETHDKNNW